MNVVTGKSNKKLGIIILVIVIIALLIGSGIFVYLFFKTDKLKSNEDLFWKYMGQNVEMTKEFTIQKDSRYENQSYKMNGKFEFDMKDSELTSFNDVKINVATQNDNNSNRTYSKIDAIYKNEKLFDMEYLRDNNTYAVKNDEIANGYIGVTNENLRELAEKLDINATEVPDEFKMPELSELLSISNDEKKHITDTYYKVVKSNINKNKYNKRKNLSITIDEKQYLANAYSVTLTKREYQTLRIKLLETLKTDSITLNLLATKMKNINKDSKYSNINSLNVEISKLIEDIQKEEVNDDQYITFTVYTNNGKTINTEIEIIDEVKYSISYISQEDKIIITKGSKVNKEDDWKQITFINRYSDSEEYILLEVEYVYNKNILFELKKNKTDVGYDINGKIALNNNSILFNGKLEITEAEIISELNESNNLIINKLEKQKVKLLITRLEQQIKKVIQDKKNIINPQIISEPQTVTDII